MEEDTLMTQATNPTEGQAPSNPGEPAAATDAAGSAQQQQQQQQQQSDGQSTPPATEAQAPANAPANAPAQGAPEAYEPFKAPQGVEFDGEVVGAFTEMARELDLPQDKAQAVIDKMTPIMQTRQMARFEAARQEWAQSSRADKEFGGDKFDENLGLAKKAMDAFATPELRTLLDQSGFGNHPEMIRMFYRAGKAISEDRHVAGRGGVAQAGDARALYKASNMNP